MIPLPSHTTVAATVLVLLLAGAVAVDIRRHRIPNGLVALGFIAGVLLAALTPSGGGYFVPGGSGGPGVSGSLLGAAVGLGVLLPLYLLRAMGAGDVKLMATSGAFLSPAGAAEAAILTLAIGGLISVAWSAWTGVLRQAVSNVRFMLVDALVRRAGGQSAAIEPVLVSAGKVPYAIAIAAGVAGHVALLRAGWSLI